jgi:hypothetical protein
MKATIDGITYEGTEEEIRRIVENPPHRPPVTVTHTHTGLRPGSHPWDAMRKDRWDATPKIAFGTEPQGEAR